MKNAKKCFGVQTDKNEKKKLGKRTGKSLYFFLRENLFEFY